MNDTQKVIKYLAIAFGIFLTVSIVYSICYAAYTVFSTFTDQVDKKKIKLEDKHSGLDSYLDIDLQSTNLEIVLGDKLEVDNPSDYIGVYTSGNKIVIKEKKHVSLKKSKNTIKITVPKDLVFKAVYFDGGAGSVNISDIKTSYLELDLGAGKILMNNVKVLDDTSIDGGAGNIEFNNCEFNNSEIDLGAGKLVFNGTLLGKNKIDSGVGSVNINLLGKLDDYKIKVDKGIGNTSLNGTTMKENESYGNGIDEIDINGGIGEIKIELSEQ